MLGIWTYLRQILLPDHETWAEIQFLFNKFLSSSIVKNCFFSWFSWHFPYCMLFWGKSANCPYGNEENVNREWNVHTKYIGAEIHFLFNKFLSFSFVKNCFFFGFLGIFLISHGFMRIIIPIHTVSFQIFGSFRFFSSNHCKSELNTYLQFFFVKLQHSVLKFLISYFLKLGK